VSRVKAKAKVQEAFNLLWQHQLSDYVTAIVWFPDQAALNGLVVSSAAGEVTYYSQDGVAITLQTAAEASVDCLVVSADGQFVAAGGQDGKVNLWQAQADAAFDSVATLDNAPAWIDRMTWHPHRNLLAFSLGRYAQIWDAEAGEVVATLNFENSTVLDLTWHPNGEWLTVSGYQGVKIWSASDWDADPMVLEIPSASTLVVWSPDGKYMASGNIDRTISVVEWENFGLPWVMRGFPGKIRQLVWSDTALKRGAPLLASSSSQSIVVWEKHPDDTVGWEGKVLGEHGDRVQAMQFQPGTATLATAGQDGWLVIWQKHRIAQSLEGAPEGFSSLVWHPQAQFLAAGGQQGEVIVWSRSVRAQGFGAK
jgi:WD40 repeat protein